MRRPATLSLAVARVLLLLGGLALLGQGCTRPQIPGRGPRLTVWGVFDDGASLAPLFGSFEKSQKQTRMAVEYRKISPPATYEDILRRALSEGRGPDIFSIHVSWLPRWRRAILPAPEEVVPLRSIDEEFVQTVGKDMVIGGHVYALPLFVDSLALYYNRDILDAAGISLPPRTWADVHDVVKRTTKFHAQEPGQIDQHGIALGAGRNVNRAADILAVLMLQNGAPLLEKGVGALRDAHALQALQFYTDFANPAKDVYTWKIDSDYSIDAFSEGEAAMMVNYSYQRPTVRLKNPRLNFGIAPLPQVNPEQPITYASYWVFVVNRQTAHPGVAWNLLRFMSSRAASAAYLRASGYPPARRDLVETLKNDRAIGVFARQSLIARTWRQPDNRVVDKVLPEAIDDVLTGRDSQQGALGRAVEQISAAAAHLQSQLRSLPEMLAAVTPR